MNAEQFQELYKMLRGSRAALLVFDARSLFMEKKYAEAQTLLLEAREVFAESRARTLKQTPEQQLDAKARDAERQLRKLKRKQDKTIEALEMFDEMLPALQKLVDRDQRRLQVEAPQEAIEAEETSSTDEVADRAESEDRSASDEPEAPIARPSDVSKALRESLAQAPPDRQLDLINQHFGFRQVESEKDLHGEALYYVQTPKVALLVCTPPENELSDSVQLTSVVDQRPIKPFSRSAFLKLGSDRKMVLLTRRVAAIAADNTAADNTAADNSAAGPKTNRAESPATTNAAPESHHEQDETQNTDQNEEQHVLDLGAFSQLLTSAQRSGLVPDAEQVGYVRDREFRMGKYDLAFQSIDTMYSRFMASAGQRTQRLAREDADIASGRLKMSPKELQAKRARDRTQTQEVERAKRRFQVVLEGLRILMNAES